MLDKARLREIIYSSNKTLALAYEDSQAPVEILRNADAALLELQLKSEHRAFADLSKQAHALFADLEHRVEHKGKLTGVDTGYKTLNGETMGLQRGDMVVLAARHRSQTSLESTCLLRGARFLAEGSRRGRVLSLECPAAAEYLMLSGVTRACDELLVDTLRTRNSQDRRGARPSSTFKSHHDASGSGPSDPDGCGECKRSGTGMVIVDYVQLQGSPIAAGGTDECDGHQPGSNAADDLRVPVIGCPSSSVRRQRPTSRLSGRARTRVRDLAAATWKNHRSGLRLLMRSSGTGRQHGQPFIDRDIQLFEDARTDGA